MTEKTTQMVKFEGEVKWATVPPRAPRGPHKDYVTEQNKDDKVYSITVECSEEKFKKLKKAGIPKLTQLEEDEKTGKTYIRLKATKVKTNPSGDNWEFDDIPVYNSDGTPLTQSIANGSTATVVASLEPMKRGGVTLRLKGVKMINLIPYEDSNSGKQDVLKALGVEEKQKEEVPFDVDDTDTTDMF